MFFGLAIDAYERSLSADQSPFINGTSPLTPQRERACSRARGTASGVTPVPSAEAAT